MKAIAGVFASGQQAHAVAEKLRKAGVPEQRVSVLVPGEDNLDKLPVMAAEQPGMGGALGGVVGGAAGAAGGLGAALALSAAIPGIGPVFVSGFLGAALFGAAGAGVGATLGGKFENVVSEGIPEDELYVYEDALRQGRSVVVALADDENSAVPIRDVMQGGGAETIDAAREKWWIGLRDAEHEHYTASGGNFPRDEKFYRLGFEAALHARTRGKEYDQVLNELAQDVEALQQKFPNFNEECFRKGYERGRAHYENVRAKRQASAAQA